ncbi:amidase [Nocardia asteroides]|uniref:amidase n=1 Tax=Nocardia asteroides TaxID=1824 RepID=UPI001E63C022|nr:amidase [Nocardia asteroides]UGT53876.1 amidase [Nocardia asteroides]
MSSAVHGFTDDALGTSDAVGLAAALRAGEVSRAEVIAAAIARTERVDPSLDAVQLACFERASAAPETAGVFAGVPAFVKDNTDIVGLPTCHGSAAFTPRPATATAGPGAQFLHSGVVVLGKSTLPEFGLTASTEFVHRAPTRNPWNPEYSAGASSGGSAALVAAGVVPIAHANDGGGSIRIPAAANGLVGLKPTRNRLLDQPGARQLPVHLVAEGVVTRSVRDTAHYLAAVEQYRPNPKLAPIGLVEGPGPRTLRIGLITEDVLGRPVHPDNAAVLASAVAILGGLGHEIVETRLDVDERFVEDFKRYWAVMAGAMTLSFRLGHRGYFDTGKLDPFTRGLMGLTARNPLGAAAAAWRLRSGTATYDRHFAEVDVLLTPVLSHPAPRIGELAPGQPFDELFAKLVDYVGFTPLNNVGGGPAVSVPHGLLPHGLPGSVQFAGRRGDERTLLELAYQLEAASPFPRIVDSPAAEGAA